MSLRINTNTQALNGHRQMLKNDMAISKSLEKLSSGLKINRAADNAAGLIISEQLRSQLNGLQQAMDNTETGISLVQTAEGALDEINQLLSKANKLILSSASSATADSNQMTANATEVSNIKLAISRILTNTQYAGQKLFDGTFNTSRNKMVQIGAFNGQNVQVIISKVRSTALKTVLTSLTAVLYNSSASKLGLVSALKKISSAITETAKLRGNLGALQSNALETNLNSLRVSYENLKAAESTVRDVDFAEESANFTRSTILVQSATAMLAQANQLPQNVLKLLG